MTAPRRPSPAEMRVLRPFVLGRRADEIAAELGLSRRSVEFHLRNVRIALGARNGAHLAALSVVLGLAGAADVLAARRFDRSAR